MFHYHPFTVGLHQGMCSVYCASVFTQGVSTCVHGCVVWVYFAYFEVGECIWKCGPLCWRRKSNGKKGRQLICFPSLLLSATSCLSRYLTHSDLVYRPVTLHLVVLKYWNVEQTDSGQLLVEQISWKKLWKGLKKKKSVPLKGHSWTEPNPESSFIRFNCRGLKTWAVCPKGCRFKALSFETCFGETHCNAAVQTKRWLSCHPVSANRKRFNTPETQH